MKTSAAANVERLAGTPATAVQAVVQRMNIAAGARERAICYELLTKYAEAARESGGASESAVVRSDIVSAQKRFSGDLFHPDCGVRTHAAALLAALADERPMAELASERYFSDFELTVRRALLGGLLRFGSRGRSGYSFSLMD